MVLTGQTWGEELTHKVSTSYWYQAQGAPGFLIDLPDVVPKEIE